MDKITRIGKAGHKPLGRPRQYDLDVALDQAIDLFSQRGYHGTSISALAQAMGLVTGSLYKAFKDKEDVFVAALNRYIQEYGKETQRLIDQKTLGIDKLQVLFESYVRTSHDIEGLKGCLVVAGAVELVALNDHVANIIERSLVAVKHQLMNMVALGQKDGSITQTMAPEVAATVLVCYLQGMRVMGKLNPPEHELAEAAQWLISVLRA